MIIRYIIERVDGGYRATCEELGVRASGKTVDAAVVALRRALEERLAHVETVARPSSPVVVRVDLQQEVDAKPESDAKPGDTDIHPGAA